jgi:hypothetical protein
VSPLRDIPTPGPSSARPSICGVWRQRVVPHNVLPPMHPAPSPVDRRRIHWAIERRTGKAACALEKAFTWPPQCHSGLGVSQTVRQEQLTSPASVACAFTMFVPAHLPLHPAASATPPTATQTGCKTLLSASFANSSAVASRHGSMSLLSPGHLRNRAELSSRPQTNTMQRVSIARAPGLRSQMLRRTGLTLGTPDF